MKLYRFLHDVFDFDSEINRERVGSPAISPFMWGLAVAIAAILIPALIFLQ
jgi:hypothetical protein